MLVLPQTLSGQARVINKAEFRDQLSRLPTKVQGLLATIADSPRLTGTRRNLLADPASIS